MLKGVHALMAVILFQSVDNLLLLVILYIFNSNDRAASEFPQIACKSTFAKLSLTVRQ